MAQQGPLYHYVCSKRGETMLKEEFEVVYANSGSAVLTLALDKEAASFQTEKENAFEIRKEVQEDEMERRRGRRERLEEISRRSSHCHTSNEWSSVATSPTCTNHEAGLDICSYDAQSSLFSKKHGMQPADITNKSLVGVGFKQLSVWGGPVGRKERLQNMQDNANTLV